ncbi:MAG: hypothetical protein FIA99_15310 [Ruminiclostridium sp.]|nr:hypothetical protein [Ruminiclostridium sp.]
MKTKKPKPKGIDPLIDALSSGHFGATDIASTIRNWKEGEIISTDDLKKVDRWIEDAPQDVSRKIAKCIVRCIYEHWVIP